LHENRQRALGLRTRIAQSRVEKENLKRCLQVACGKRNLDIIELLWKIELFWRSELFWSSWSRS